jgi:acetate---CoA ligase (ADP-forming)
MGMLGPGDLQGTSRNTVLTRMMQPRSVAIIGMSTKPNTVGHLVLQNIRVNGFKGDIHLVGRSAGEIDGLPIRANIDDLPENVDVAVLSVPAAGVSEALQGCISRKVATAVVFASGFAELGDKERGEQEKIGQLARESGIGVIGPNCLGYNNYVNGFLVSFTGVTKLPRVAPGTSDGVALVAQSGGLVGHLRLALLSRSVPVTYSIATGNEADLGLGDFVRYLIDDEATRVITIYAEAVRDPAAFLLAAEEARAKGKPIVMLHTGRGVRAQEAAKSHTGALASNYAVMRSKVERAGVVLVETMDELSDVSEILSRYPKPKKGGLGIISFSGAFCSIAHDICEDLGIEVPSLSPETEAALRTQVPTFIPPKNPLDLGTQPLWQPELVQISVEALLGDPAIGGVAISIPPAAPANANAFIQKIIAAKSKSDKPVMLAMLGDSSTLPPEFMAAARESKVVLSRSSDRTLRAMAKVVTYGNHYDRIATSQAIPLAELPVMISGTQPEWLGKKVFSATGIPVPQGDLANSVDQAIEIATRIGFPVVLKAQAGALAHKTEAGGVILNIGNSDGVRTAWKDLHDNVQRAKPGLQLDGVLVETMSARGLELVVGARRDPQWGVVLLVGLGGVLVEALQDIRLLAPDAKESEILSELEKLKTARLLHGFRNIPPVDREAVAKVAMAIGRLMLTHLEIVEIDINPLMVYGEGQGAVALDALIVTS